MESKKKLPETFVGDFSIDPNDLFMVINARLNQIGMVPHLPSADHFYINGVRQIITQGFTVKKEIINKRESTAEDRDIAKIVVEVEFTDVQMKPPTTTHYQTGEEVMLTPAMAHISDKNYSAMLEVSMNIKATAYMKNGTTVERKASASNIRLCKVPTIVRSINCHTRGKTKQGLQAMREDPSDPGGYFILKGVEWVIDAVENILFNQPKIYRNINYRNSLARLEFISKPGDTYQNSDLMLLRYFKDKTLTVEVVRDKLKETPFPFYMIFRALGWNTDMEIINNIAYGFDSDMSSRIVQIVREMFASTKYKIGGYDQVYEQVDVMIGMIKSIPAEKFKYLNLKQDAETNITDYNVAINEIKRILDTHFLPHIGMQEKHRTDKCRFLAMLIRKLILTHMGVIQPTDRDSYKNKRVAAAGENYAKSFKTLFNANVVLAMKNAFGKAFDSAPYKQVDLVATVKNSIDITDFEKSMAQVITNANKSTMRIKKQQIVNRLSSQMLNRKNSLNALAALRQVVSTSSDSSKQSERAHLMRRVHPSFWGMICPVHTSEGEKVGQNKQMSMFASISSSASSEVLKKQLLDDSNVIALNTVSPERITSDQLSSIYVNGDWIGFTADSINLVTKYRTMRRNLKLDPETTIYWDVEQDEVWFWVDVGRMLRPLLIVYNNRKNPELFPAKDRSEKAEFKQGLLITQKHIDGLYQNTITIDDLVEQKIVEYISAEEQENCFLCHRIEKLKRDKNNELQEYTHCDIPEGILGITGLTSPFAHMNQTPRVTFQTSQAKQTCGLYAQNWPYRINKDTFLQYICETPLVRTIATNFVTPNGNNAVVAIACNTGWNQEDSLIFSKAALERMMYHGCKFTFYKTEVEQKEELKNPDASLTRGIKCANYEKLINGVIAKGSIVHKGDVLIGKVLKMPRSKDQKYLYEDKSLIYKEDEPAVVHATVVGRNEADEQFCKVSLRKIRPVHVGDKFSSRAGQKGVCALRMRESDLPFTSSGIRPSIIVNPHALPSRMTIGQLVESLLGLACSAKGTHSDGTIFRPVDIESIGEELESRGFERHGRHRLYNGLTGEFIDTLIFMGPTYYQRLQKFVLDTVYSVAHSSTDAMTMQPLDGKASKGGLRLGEMEKDALSAQGVMRLLNEKYREHSDGFDQYMCRCGKEATVNVQQNKYICVHCGDKARIVPIETTYSSKLFRQEMQSCNVGIRCIPEPLKHYVYENEAGIASNIENNIDKEFIDKVESFALDSI